MVNLKKNPLSKDEIQQQKLNSHVIPGPGMAPYVVFLYTEQYMGVRRYGTTHVNKYCIFHTCCNIFSLGWKSMYNTIII